MKKWVWAVRMDSGAADFGFFYTKKEAVRAAEVLNKEAQERQGWTYSPRLKLFYVARRAVFATVEDWEANYRGVKIPKELINSQVSRED